MKGLSRWMWLVLGLVMGMPQSAHAGAVALATYVRSDNAIVMGKDVDNACTGGSTCTISRSLNLGTGYTQAEIFLTRWGVKNNSTNTPTDSLKGLHVDVTKGSYNSATGAFSWTANFNFTSDANANFQADYYFTIVLSNGSAIGLSTLSNSCSDTTHFGSCVNTATASGILPSGKTFLGWGLSSVDMVTSSGKAVKVHQIAADVSSFTTSGTNVNQTLNCSFTGLASGGSSYENFTCTTKAVALVVDNPTKIVVVSSGTDSSYPSQSFSYSAGSTNPSPIVNGQAQTFITSTHTPLNGVLIGLDAFNVLYSSPTTDSLFQINVGCQGFYPSTVTGHTTDVELDWNGWMENKFFVNPTHTDPYNSTVKCLVGYQK